MKYINLFEQFINENKFKDTADKLLGIDDDWSIKDIEEHLRWLDKKASKKKTQRLKKQKLKENYSELEQYRKLILKQLIDSKIGKQIRNAVEDEVGKEAVEGVYIIGSVLDSKKFHEESDIDIAVLINVPNMDKGTNEEMSYKLSQTYSIPDGGFVDVSIWNRSKPLGKMVKLKEGIQ